MRLTPLDIRDHRFLRRLRGYDPEEVDAFLRMIADDYASLAKEAEDLRGRTQELEACVKELRSQEQALRDTLVTARSVSEDLKRTAVKEAEAILAEAEARAEKILDTAHRRAARLMEDIREMKSLRSRIAAAVRNAIETHLALLDGLAKDSPEDRLLEGKLAGRGRRRTGEGA